VGATMEPAADHRNDSTPRRRQEGHDVLMTRSLEACLAVEPHASVSRIVEMLDECIKPAMEYRCLNPTCENTCLWPGERGLGRPKLYCSKRCRQIHDRVRDRLGREVETLEKVAARPDVTKRQREELRTAIGRRHWALARYTPTLRAGKQEADA